MEDKVFNKHDHFFRNSLSDVRVMRAAIQDYLPIAVQQQLNLETLSLCNGSYIDDNFKQSQSDILYRVECVNGSPGYIYLLWEHQSTYDSTMPLRLLSYSCRIMEQHLKQGHEKLPLVIPSLIYNGKKPYPGSTDLFEMFENPELAREFWLKPFNLVDLPSMDNQDIAQSLWTAWPFMILKHMRTKDFRPELIAMEKITEQLVKAGGEAHIKTMLHFSVEQLEMTEPDALIDHMSKTLNKEAKKMATAKQQWIQQGVQQGKLQGIQQGIQQGKLQGKLQGIQQGKKQGSQAAVGKMVINLAKNNVDVNTIAKSAGLSVEEVEQLMHSTIK